MGKEQEKSKTQLGGTVPAWSQRGNYNVCRRNHNVYRGIEIVVIDSYCVFRGSCLFILRFGILDDCLGKCQHCWEMSLERNAPRGITDHPHNGNGHAGEAQEPG